MESTSYSLTLRPDACVDYGDGIRFFDYLLALAVQQEASDIHIEVQEHDVCIRFRIQGALVPCMNSRPDHAAQVVSRCKVLMGLDVIEHQRPQDGALRVCVGRQYFDIRASFFPALWGEKTVIRLLGVQQQALHLYTLPLPGDMLARLYEISRAAQGLFLVTGPTGAGKTTTLYGLLQAVDREARNVVTLEDPIEYRIERVTQTHIDAYHSFSFAQAVRSLLRQDPDVALIGELRDKDTAQSAIEAALTGHLVLSSLHTGTASAAPIRLREMGIEPYLLAHALKGVLAQRLVPLLCAGCTSLGPLSKSESEWADLQGIVLSQTGKAAGCTACRFTGSQGQTIVGELWHCDKEAMVLLQDKEATQADFEKCAVKNGMIPLVVAGADLVRAGKVAISELMCRDL